MKKKNTKETKNAQRIIPLGQNNIELVRQFLIDEVTAMESYYKIAAVMDDNEFAQKAMEKCVAAKETLKKVERIETLCYVLNVYAAEGLFEPAMRFGTTLTFELSEGSAILATDELERSRAEKKDGETESGNEA